MKWKGAENKERVQKRFWGSAGHLRNLQNSTILLTEFRVQNMVHDPFLSLHTCVHLHTLSVKDLCFLKPVEQHKLFFFFSPSKNRSWSRVWGVNDYKHGLMTLQHEPDISIPGHFVVSTQRTELRAETLTELRNSLLFISSGGDVTRPSSRTVQKNTTGKKHDCCMGYSMQSWMHLSHTHSPVHDTHSADSTSSSMAVQSRRNTAHILHQRSPSCPRVPATWTRPVHVLRPGVKSRHSLCWSVTVLKRGRVCDARDDKGKKRDTRANHTPTRAHAWSWHIIFTRARYYLL